MARYAVNLTDESMSATTDLSLSTSNATDAPTLKPEELLRVFELIISGIIIVCALFGNLIVVNTLWRKRKSLTRMHFFIYHLCIADIISALLSQFPLFIWDITFLFYGPNILCKLVKFFQLFPIYLSSYILILTAFDRYLAICHPLLGLRGNQKLRMRTMVVVVWICSAIFATPQMYFFGMKLIPQYGGETCWAQFSSVAVSRLYVTSFTLLVFVIPSVLLALIYGQICLAVWQNMGKATGHAKPNKHATRNHNESWDEDEEQDGVEMKKNGNSHNSKERQTPLYRSHTAESRVSRAKIKTIKMTLTIVTVYIVCWSPFFFALMCQVWELMTLHAWVDTLLNILANLNSCTNPWIYLVFSGNVIGAIKDLFCLCHGCRKSSEGYHVATTTAQADDPSSRFIHSPAGPRTTFTSTTGAEHKVDSNANSAF